MPALRSHTHCQVAQNSRPTSQNLSKSMATQTHGKIADPIKTKNSTINARKCLIMNKAQHLTMYIKHLAGSASFEAVTTNETCSDLTVQSYEMPNDFIYEPLCLIQDDQT